MDNSYCDSNYHNLESSGDELPDDGGSDLWMICFIGFVLNNS